MVYVLFIHLYTYATSISVPYFDHDICGRGFPTAAQSKYTFDPSRAIVEWGIWSKGIGNEQQILKILIF